MTITMLISEELHLVRFGLGEIAVQTSLVTTDTPRGLEW